LTAPKAIAKGLEGVIIDDSSICMIDGNAGRLIYRGYDIHDLAANLTFEEVAYLLWNGDLPTKTQLAELNKRLIMERSIPADLKATIRNLPRTSNTLDVFEPPSQRSGRAFR
jgi:citrate synthase